MQTTPQSHLTTSQNIRHVYICNGKQQKHIHPGFVLLRTKALICPTCGAAVTDITGSPVAQAYSDFARFDLAGPQ